MNSEILNYFMNPGEDTKPLGDALLDILSGSATVAIDAPLTSSLIPNRGPIPTYISAIISNPAVATSIDCYGILKNCRANEAQFRGARRVENLLRYSEHLSRTEDSSWLCLNGASIEPVTDPEKFGKNGEMTAWRLSRGAQVNSVLRCGAPIKGRTGVNEIDLLLPVRHVLGVNLRKSMSSGVASAEPRIYTPGGQAHVTKIVNLSDEMRTFALSFTPARARRISSMTWADGQLTVICQNHGYSVNMNVRLAGSLPVTFDINSTVVAVIDTDTFKVICSSNPGTLARPGWTQMQYVFGVSPGSWATTSASSIDIEQPYISEVAGYDLGKVPEYVPTDTLPTNKYFNGAGVDGVKYFDTYPNLVADAYSAIVGENPIEEILGMKGIATYGTALNRIKRRDAEDFSSWVKSNSSISVQNYISRDPTGAFGASILVEGTHDGEHSISLPSGNLTTANVLPGLVSVITIYFGYNIGNANSSNYAWVEFGDLSGISQIAYIDLQNGLVGSKTTGILAVHAEEIGAQDNIQYYRAHLSVLHGTGTSAPALKIGMSVSDGSKNFNGNGSSHIVIWGASFVGGTDSRPVAAPYGRYDWDQNAILAGCTLSFLTKGILNRSALTASCSHSPYYSFYQPGRVSWTAPIYFRCEPVQTISSATPTMVGQAMLDRFGIVIRPNFGTSSSPNHLTKIAFDHYNGDVTRFYKFKSGREYSEGEIVLPTSIKPNNPDGLRMWTVVKGGTAGAEPTWPAVPSVPSVEVASGSVIFQVTHNNGINGQFEPYNGAETQPPVGFMPSLTTSFSFGESSFYAFANGSAMHQQTWPSPVNPEYGFRLRRDVAAVYIGTLGTDFGFDNTTLSSYTSSNVAGLLPRQSGFTKNVKIWNTQKSADFLSNLTNEI